MDVLANEDDVADQISDMKLDGKAAFRDQAAFLKVLEDSSKYRNKLPEPSGDSPRKLEGLPHRSSSHGDSNGDKLSSPRTSGPLPMRPLSRSRYSSPMASPRDSPHVGSPPLNKEHKGLFQDLGSTRQRAVGTEQKSRQAVSLPPVTAKHNSTGKAVNSARIDNIMLYSRQGDDVISRLKQTGRGTDVGIGGESGAAGSPRGTPRNVPYDSARKLNDR